MLTKVQLKATVMVLEEVLGLTLYKSSNPWFPAKIQTKAPQCGAFVYLGFGWSTTVTPKYMRRPNASWSECLAVVVLSTQPPPGAC